MKSITIHNLESDTAELIDKKSKESGLSLNKTIKLLLRKALGISDQRPNRKEEFGEFFGIWSDSEFLEFQKATMDFNEIDETDW